VVRRAPFSENPRVGTRGHRTHQRILDAALEVFGDEGYHGGSVDRIAQLGGCSRVSFYQYFASKEDLLRQLAAQVVRELSASTEALDPLSPDAEGWDAMRVWVGRYAEIYARYEPVFNVYQTAARSADVLAVDALRTGEQMVARIEAHMVAPTLPRRPRDPVIRLALECLAHVLDIGGILRSVTPAAYPSERVEVAITDVLHRTFFGVRSDVNVHPPAGPPPPALELDATSERLQQDDHQASVPSRSGNGALDALLASGRDVFVRRGYHNTRVDDLVAAAGVSHGAFYRYFRNKGEFARLLTARATRVVAGTLLEFPDLFAPDASSELRVWLGRYNAVEANEAAMLRVWVDGALQDPALRAQSAPPLDWGRRRLAHCLHPRAFGDDEIDGVVLVALLGVFGARQRPAAEIDAAAHIIERGLLGR